MNKQTFTLTFGDCAENHKGMEKIGNCELESGLDLEDLARAGRWFEEKGAEYEIIYLNELLEGVEDVDYDEDVEGAYLLVVKGGVNYLLDDDEGADKMFLEQEALEKDKKAWMYGRVVNKNARHNLCFSDFSQEADYEEGKGTVVNFRDVPLLKEMREKWMEVVENEKVEGLQCEGNYYYDVTKTFIGFHGDTERKMVIAVRLGADFPLFYQWYYKGEEVGKRYKKVLSHGDVYIMSNKAVGWDWKKKNVYTLRHAAGFEKALKLKAASEEAEEKRKDDDEEEKEKEIVVVKKIVRKGKDVKQEIDIFQKIKKTSLLVPKDFKKIWDELSLLYLDKMISKDDMIEKIPIKHLQCIGEMLKLDKLSKYNGSNKEELVDRIIEKMKKKEEDKKEENEKLDYNIEHYPDGKKSCEVWKKNGKEVKIFLYFQDGRNGLSFEYYYDEDGKLHREGDKPAHISYFKSGKVERQQYYIHGNLHRDGDEPADIVFKPNGERIFADWYQNGELHRDNDMPAEVSYNNRNGLEFEKWFRNGVFYRREGDAPSEIIYWPEGGIKANYWHTVGGNQDDRVRQEEYKKDGSMKRVKDARHR